MLLTSHGCAGGVVTKRTVEVVDYDPGWALSFETERALLEGVLTGVIRKVSHIGSTAVVGLAAKPIIDIQMEVTSLAELDAKAPDIEALGYEARGENGIPGRRYFCKGSVCRTHHVHAFVVGDNQLLRHLALRDYLAANSDVANDYARLKRALAQSNGNDPQGYQAGKEAFLARHMALAVAWFINRGMESEL